MARLDVEGLRAKNDKPHDLLRASDGKILFLRRWDPSSKSPATVLLFHGITGYSEPYGRIIAESLSNSGFAVYGLDLRGHGLSDGKRGDYPSRQRYVNDLMEAVSYVKERSEKLVVLGHSLGVFSAIAAENRCRDKIDGLVLLSAAKKVKPIVYPKPTVGSLLKSLIGISILRGSPLIDYRRDGMTGVTDPLFNFSYSSRFYTVIYGSGALAVLRMFQSGAIESPYLEFSEKLTIPLFVGVGENDELFSVESVKELSDSMDCSDKEFLVVPGGRHAYFPNGSWTPLVAWLQTKF